MQGRRGTKPLPATGEQPLQSEPSMRELVVAEEKESGGNASR